MTRSETGTVCVNVDRMVELLSESYIALIENGIPLRSFPSVMIWGPPGVGKSQGVREIGKRIENSTGKRVVITDVRLLLYNPVDLRGIPAANEDRTLAVWLRPKIFQMDESDDVINILFLDEISAAPPAVQAAAYQITLDRAVGEHKLPENCIVIAAGNRVTDRSVAYNMPRALANRLCHFEVKEDHDSWHKWAVRSGIHEYVTGYLEYNKISLLRSEQAGSSLAFPTPRSWEMVSNILNNISDDLEKVYPLIVGCIGYDAASMLRSWVELYESLPSNREIFTGICEDGPRSEELLIALRSSMVVYARKHPIKELIDTSIEYACNLPWSFRGELMYDYYLISELRPILENNAIFQAARMRGKV